MTSYSQAEQEQLKRVNSNSIGLIEAATNNNASPKALIKLKKMMSAEKRIAELEQQLRGKDDEIARLHEAIKQMPEFSKLEGKKSFLAL